MPLLNLILCFAVLLLIAINFALLFVRCHFERKALKYFGGLILWDKQGNILSEVQSALLGNAALVWARRLVVIGNIACVLLMLCSIILFARGLGWI